MRTDGEIHSQTLGRESPNWISVLGPPPPRAGGSPWKRVREKIVKAREVEETRTLTTESTNQGSEGLTETEAATTEPL